MMNQNPTYVVIDVENLARRMTLRAKLKKARQWVWRATIASWLIRLAAWVMWVNVDIEFVGGMGED